MNGTATAEFYDQIPVDKYICTPTCTRMYKKCPCKYMYEYANTATKSL